MFRKLLGFMSRVVTPTYSACGRCGVTWAFVKWHSTMYTDSMGCFPLCEHCWSRLTPQTRLPYYAVLVSRWELTDVPTWNLIERAVKEGK